MYGNNFIAQLKEYPFWIGHINDASITKSELISKEPYI
jgi:hypothetical protein